MSHPTALIVDDVFANIVLLKKFLSKYDIQCISATSGKEAFELAQHNHLDIIFTDLLMPVSTWDGYETIRQLKSHSQTAHIPVIAVTAAGLEDEAWQVGCDGYLQRPFHANELRDVLGQLLN